MLQGVAQNHNETTVDYKLMEIDAQMHSVVHCCKLFYSVAKCCTVLQSMLMCITMQNSFHIISDSMVLQEVAPYL